MAYFDFDVKIELTHTQTIEADNIEEATEIVRRLSDVYYFVTDMYEELTTDFDSFDDDHMVICDPVPCQWPNDCVEVTVDPNEYIKEA